MKFGYVNENDNFIPSASKENAVSEMLNREDPTFEEYPLGLNVEANEILLINDCDEELGILTPVVITGLASNNLDISKEPEYQVYKAQKATEETKDNVLVIMSIDLDKKAENTAPIGRAKYSGIVSVKVKVSDITHKFVDFDESGDFISAASGKYKLLYPAATIGDQLLKIILGGGASGGDTYNGMFKIIQTAADKIKIVDGKNESSSIAGKVNINYFPASAAVQEFTITKSGYIYLQCKLVGSPDATGATGTIILSETEKESVSGDYYDLISRVDFADEKISDYNRENVNKNIIMGGDCGTP